MVGSPRSSRRTSLFRDAQAGRLDGECVAAVLEAAGQAKPRTHDLRPVRLLALAGYTIWLAYGLAIGDVPLILVDVAGVAGAALVLRVTLTLRRRRACPTF